MFDSFDFAAGSIYYIPIIEKKETIFKLILSINVNALNK